MKIAAISELKAKLARYIRLAKAGEEIQIQDRGLPVAKLIAAGIPPDVSSVPPRKNQKDLARMRFTVRPAKEFDIVAVLLEERAKR